MIENVLSPSSTATHMIAELVHLQTSCILSCDVILLLLSRCHVYFLTIVCFCIALHCPCHFYVSALVCTSLQSLLVAFHLWSKALCIRPFVWSFHSLEWEKKITCTTLMLHGCVYVHGIQPTLGISVYCSSSSILWWPQVSYSMFIVSDKTLEVFYCLHIQT